MKAYTISRLAADAGISLETITETDLCRAMTNHALDTLCTPLQGLLVGMPQRPLRRLPKALLQGILNCSLISVYINLIVQSTTRLSSKTLSNWSAAQAKRHIEAVAAGVVIPKQTKEVAV